jgi:hypothetical protein
MVMIVIAAVTMILTVGHEYKRGMVWEVSGWEKGERKGY